MSVCTTAVLRRLLACLLVAAVSANAGENTNQTKREVATPFLSDVIQRIENDRQQIARPVQDLKVALDRIAEIFGQEAVTVEDSPTLFELSENAETLPTLASTSNTNAVLPTAPTRTSSPSPNNAVTATLSPQDLQALYHIASQKGLTLDLSAIQEGILPVSGVKSGPAGVAGPTPLPPSPTGSTLGEAESYYYYFVPIKNLQGVPQQQMMQALMEQPTPESHAAAMVSPTNSTADAVGAAAIMAGGADRAVEPLFMAMAGFVGMALMFVASVLFLPKLGALRSLKHAPDEVASIGKLVLQSIEGKDCTERLTCEIGRAARTLKLGGKPLRVLELILPPPMAIQISRIRRAAARKEKCNFIPCKFRRPPSLQFPTKKPTGKPPLKPSLFKPAFKPPLRPVRDDRPYPPLPTKPSIYAPSYPEFKSSTSQRPPATSPRPHWSPKTPSAPRPATLRPQQKKNPKASSQSREPRVRSR